jgi:hypothetical protein
MKYGMTNLRIPVRRFERSTQMSTLIRRSTSPVSRTSPLAVLLSLNENLGR